MLSAGNLSILRPETEEGLDKKLAVQYYSRWSFIHGLLPAIRAARDANEDAKVMSIFAAGYGGPIDVDDLGLKKRFNPVISGPCSTYNDLMCEVSLTLSTANTHPLLVGTAIEGLYLVILKGICTAQPRNRVRARLPRICAH